MELEIGPGAGPDSYVVRVLRSVGGGEPTGTFTLALDELLGRRRDLESSVLSSAVATRRVLSDTEAAIQDVGRRLFESAFAGEVLTAYRTSRAVASERGGGVQIALRLTAPGLAALPWEALFDPEADAYLCRKDSLVRHVAAGSPTPALAVAPPLRVLGMVASPRGLPPIDADRERELLTTALRPQIDAGLVEIDWIDEATWSRVHDKLLEREWHVLHFIGHGTYDTQTDEGVLAFVGHDGRTDLVTASSLADLLDEAEPTPRLVLLNSCQSGAGGTDDLFSGTAAALAHSGIQAVAAMQFAISDTAAIEFARGFYAALAHGRGVDEAVRSGRIGILGTGRGTLEWVTPVLYLRGEDAHLFDIRRTVPPPAAATSRRRGAATTSAARTSGPAVTASGTWRRRAPWLVAGGVAVVAIGIVTGVALMQSLQDDGTGGTGSSDATTEVVVPMNEAWTGSGVFCNPGDTLRISARGEFHYDSPQGLLIGPEGIKSGELAEGRAFSWEDTAALMGQVSPVDGPFFVGVERAYECTDESELLLGPNDRSPSENVGELQVRITRIPAE